MNLQHINLEELKTTTLNVRKKGAKQVDDLVPSIRSLGILQPLLVRPNGKGYEIVAGQRRYHALETLSQQEGINDPVPCIVMKKGDDAKAIEASLAENIARLPMDEIDQYKAFSALIKKGQSVEDISTQFGISKRLVKQRLAIANLISPILTAYQKGDIPAQTVRLLTMASKKQQKEWVALFKNKGERAPHGYHLKCWLFGGAEIPTEHALFNLGDYKGGIVSNLFDEERYFEDANLFWECQNIAIAKLKEDYLADGWSDVTIFDVGNHFPSYDYVDTAKEQGGKVYIAVSKSGEVTCYEGQLSKKEAKKKQGKNKSDKTATKENPEITKAMQNYLNLHRHSAVRTELLSHQGIALRLAVAQIIAGSSLWSVLADPQQAVKAEISESLSVNKAETMFSEERQRVFALLGMSDTSDETLVHKKEDWDKSHDIHDVFAKLLKLDDISVSMILTFVVAETLPCGSTLVEALGHYLTVDLKQSWQPDEVFFDLLRDKEVINAMVKEAASKRTADAHVTSTAKVQKKIIQDCINGNRKGGKKDWSPRYINFPMQAYTKRGGIRAIDHWKTVKKLIS